MPFYQNPFDALFHAPMPLSDRQYTITWKVPENLNRSDLMLAWNAEPYDLSVVGDRVLTINIALDTEFKAYAARIIDVSGATPGATTAAEVATALNADGMFSTFFVASTKNLINGTVNPPLTVLITGKRSKVGFRSFIANTGAEKFLRFNKKAGVAELPSYFERHTVANLNTFEDCVGGIVRLDETIAQDQAIITDAGFDYTAMQEDWELLDGRSGLFPFRLHTYDGSSRLVTTIEFPAGAKAGDLGKRIDYQYSGAATDPSIVTEIPYIVTSSDVSTATPP
jgi:hypothetical protein